MLSEQLDMEYLAAFLQGNYYQTIWDDYDNDAQIWNAWKERSSDTHRLVLVSEIEQLLKRGDDVVFAFINGNSGDGLYFHEASDAVKWLKELHDFISPS